MWRACWCGMGPSREQSGVLTAEAGFTLSIKRRMQDCCDAPPKRAAFAFPKFQPHPVFMLNARGVPLEKHFLFLLLDLARAPRHTTHVLTGVSHATIERLHARLMDHICAWVEQKQECIKVGLPARWVDIHGRNHLSEKVFLESNNPVWQAVQPQPYTPTTLPTP